MGEKAENKKNQEEIQGSRKASVLVGFSAQKKVCAVCIQKEKKGRIVSVREKEKEREGDVVRGTEAFLERDEA
jgi:hypothetical protein